MRRAALWVRSLRQRRGWRTLAVIAVLGLLFGMAGMGEILEDNLRISRNSLNPADFSGDVVLIAVDDASQREAGAWPWKRSVQARMLNRIQSARPRLVLFDITYDFPTDPAEDMSFERALAARPNVVLPIRLRIGDGKGARILKQPIERFRRHVTLGNISAKYNYAMSVWDMNYAATDGAVARSSFAPLMAGVKGTEGSSFPIDYRYRLSSIPTIRAVDVINGRADLRALNGKTVIIGPTSQTIGDQFTVPGRGRRGGVYFHIYAAETLKQGRPLVLGWLPAMIIALAFSAKAMALGRARSQLSLLALGGTLLIAIPMLSEPQHIFVDVMSGVFVLVSAASVILWRRYRASSFTNSASGLPNISALKARTDSSGRALIIARVLNYPQLAATLSATDERALVEQVVSRLSVGAPTTIVHQGDDGIFAWLAEPGIAIGHHVEALHSLFRNPARIGSLAYDIAISFGVEIGSGRTIANRLGSALVAAEEAANEGLKWKYHDPERFKDENWRLSLLAQLDEAIDRGEVWVAYQPQLDLKTNRIRGAEALARWTHPEKGPISPHEFITAAEQHGRIDRLTLFMLDRAIAAAAKINRSGHAFNVSVNLSARTLSRRSLPEEVRSLLDKHRLKPSQLTLELTETAALANDGSDLDPLIRLRDLGVGISIDDYGTGLSTLDYLKKVPAHEIKIDQGFVKAMNDTRGDLVMVTSTVALAHSLGRTVVAEGVENRETLEVLRGLGCDAAQGYFIGRPMSYDGVLRRLDLQRKGRAA